MIQGTIMMGLFILSRVILLDYPIRVFNDTELFFFSIFIINCVNLDLIQRRKNKIGNSNKKKRVAKKCMEKTTDMFSKKDEQKLQLKLKP